MIHVEHLSYAYPGREKNAVDDISFDIRKGEIFGFLGPNGAGKSTTQKILIGLLKQYSGRVHAFGMELRDMKDEYYRRIGVAFEFPNLYGKFTALENLRFFQSLYGGAGHTPEALLERLGLKEDAGVRVSGYSKGMKMRLNFARALLHDPDILFLDEPTSGLDPVNARLLKDMVLEQKEAGKTLFLTTHDMHTAAELCDRVAFLVEGRIAMADSPGNLKLSYGRGEVSARVRDDGQEREGRFPLGGLGDNTEFISFLQSGEVLTIHSEEASLEDVFIRVTGRKLV